MTSSTLHRRDWIFIAVCAVVTVASLLVIARWFGEAFPEASIEFEYDRHGSREIAERHLRALNLDVAGMKHAVVFESDSIARIFLERTLGLQRANRVMTDDVLVWYWRHRWFVPLQEEEYAVEIAPTGELVAFARALPESAAMPSVSADAARRAAEVFLIHSGADLTALDLVAQSERNLPARVQRIFTWESKSIRPGGAPYRYVATVDGGEVSSFARRLRVPEEWIRGYREMRSKNEAAGRVDLIFMLVTMIAALAVFIARIRRGDMQMRFLLAIGAVTAVLVTGVTLNSFPSALAGYDTTTSYPAFLAQLLIVTIVQAIGSAMLLIVVCGAGEVLYRERLPQHLAIPKLWTLRALASKRVFLSLILGYSLVGFFIAYQVAFYIAAAQFGAWAPADIPYDDILNTAFPWLAVLFAGFFPAFSEEFLSRAFSIPFFERVLRSRLFAIVLAGFIWGFGHATYPQQPFYIRGLEVGLAGVLIGLLMYRYGLLALLIWHYTVDAVYTSLLLFRSGNTYYVASAAIASLVFALPLIASIVLYVRNRGFVPDEDLSNATLPLTPPPPPPVEP
ncbi:MAG TPA: CPBP family intramembrane glutamic endopeptidase, partial [Thermoanaerobaculia bacterium]|nr:CPBP family intramembrane glutamic endopeptidase [Thermoanaerobaculia bacterium]